MRCFVLLFALLIPVAPAYAPPGGFRPAPRFSVTGGGGRGTYFFGFPGGGEIAGFLVVAAIVGVIWLVCKLIALAWDAMRRPAPKADAAPIPVGLIHSAEAVRGQAEATEKLMAEQGPEWEPAAVRVWLEAAFRQVLDAWSKRDYAPLLGILSEPMRAHHESQLRLMREAGERERCEDVAVERIDFVERTPEGVLALLTFSGRFWYDDGWGNYRRGDQRRMRFQEAWFLKFDQGRWTAQANLPAGECRLAAA